MATGRLELEAKVMALYHLAEALTSHDREFVERATKRVRASVAFERGEVGRIEEMFDYYAARGLFEP